MVSSCAQFTMTPSPLTLDAASALIRRSSFRPSAGERFGIEIELMVNGPGGRQAPHHQVIRAVEAMAPLRSTTPISFEPGGQIELSPAPHASADEACDALAADLDQLTRALADAGLTLAAVGMDPRENRARVLRSPRYDAMAAHFAADGPAGEAMMCRSAGIQVNLDWGPSPAHAARRWRLAHQLGPVLVASFANSPAVSSTGVYRSARMVNWGRIDPGRAAPVRRGTDTTGSPVEDWVNYVLGAPVMLIRSSPHYFMALRGGFSFGDWIKHGHSLGRPVSDDLRYHLTTLFPPVRPRAWMELRMIDSLPDPWWRVAVAVASILITDPIAGPETARMAGPVEAMWEQSARSGLGEPRLGQAAAACFAIALEAMVRTGVSATTIALVRDYAELFVNRGRCPADTKLDAVAANWAGPSHRVARRSAVS